MPHLELKGLTPSASFQGFSLITPLLLHSLPPTTIPGIHMHDPVKVRELYLPVRRAGLHVVVYTGTFDPLHNGHLMAAQKCLDAGADEVVFVPKSDGLKAKQGVTARTHRLAISCAAASAHEHMNVFLPDPTPYMPCAEDWSLRKLLSHIGTLYRTSQVSELCGSDTFVTYPPDAHPCYFFGQTIFLASRPPYPEVDVSKIPHCINIGTTKDISSSSIRQAIRDGLIDSLAEHGLCKDAVHYIQENQLYGIEGK